MTFFVAELQAVHVSGILAIVVLGLGMARQGKTKISSESEVAVHNVWQTIAFAAETVIFILAGLMISVRNIDNGEHGIAYYKAFTWENFGKVIILYMMMTLIRLTLLLLLKPIMNMWGYPIDVRHVIVMTWGALRGALGIFLALFLVNDKKIPAKVSGLILYYASMIALFTLVINATTTGFVVERLKLSKETATTKKFMYMFLQHM